jgi:cyclopropane fatty-acyl-phospholipid synthase-like methyltransferase
MQERQPLDSAAVGQFYDALRSSELSAAALAHGEAYIGQECLLTPDEIVDWARQAGVTAGTSVLDMGSGIGGPACYLAQRLGCRVLGVDLSAVGHEQAVARARDAGVSHLAQFRLGDIHTVDLPPASFDVILSLDVWCHTPRRAALLQRCATLLRPGGRLAFYDHVERQPMPSEQRQQFCALWRFPNLETPRSYLEAMRAAGLRVRYHTETSTYAMRFYTRLLAAYLERRADMEAMRGPERYQEGLERLQMSQHFAAAGVLGQFACIAEK